MYFYLPIAAVILKYMPMPFASPDKAKNEKPKTSEQKTEVENEDTTSTNNVNKSSPGETELRQRAQESRVD